MTTIDLSTPPAVPAGLLAALPRRMTLTLPELRLLAERAGGAPLPFDLAAPSPSAGASELDAVPGESRTAPEDEAFAAALSTLREPSASLTRRGLLGEEGGVEGGLLGAVGLLATPDTAVDLDVAVAGVRARAWHRQAGDAVAALATVDGLVFELAWFHTSHWAAELGRAPVLPEDCPVGVSAVPRQLDLPYELADAAAEAVRGGRSDLVEVLVSRHAGEVLGPDGPLGDAAASAVLVALATECQGRLRVLAADCTSGGTGVIGVVSWTLLADGWHALRSRHSDQAGQGVHRVELTAVEPSELPLFVAPVLAEVTR